jgi:hypothetical protein
MSGTDEQDGHGRWRGARVGHRRNVRASEPAEQRRTEQTIFGEDHAIARQQVRLVNAS